MLKLKIPSAASIEKTAAVEIAKFAHPGRQVHIRFIKSSTGRAQWRTFRGVMAIRASADHKEVFLLRSFWRDPKNGVVHWTILREWVIEAKVDEDGAEKPIPLPWNTEDDADVLEVLDDIEEEAEEKDDEEAY